MSTYYHRKPVSLPEHLSDLRSLGHRSMNAHKHHLVTRLNQLENERTRLQREAEMWERRRKRTEDKLIKKCRQISVVKKKLGLNQPHRLTNSETVDHSRAQTIPEISQTKPVTSISFEY